MAGYRQIHPKIWKDEWFIELEPDEKLFFIYLFSNDETTFTGLYKLPIRVMVNETGLSKERVMEMLEKFKKAGKVIFESGVVWVVNMRKHHSSDSPKVTARIKYDMLSIPECELKTRCLRALHIISIPYPDDTDSESLKDKNKIKEEKINIFLLYEQNIGAVPPTLVDELKEYENEYMGEWIVEGFKIACENNKRSWAYIRAILKRWKAEGYKNGSKEVVREAVAAEVF